jgi:hypothetical protein
MKSEMLKNIWKGIKVTYKFCYPFLGDSPMAVPIKKRIPEIGNKIVKQTLKIPIT